MKTRIISLLLLLLAGPLSWAQKPVVSWSVSQQALDSEGTYRITMTADIQEGFHIYDTRSYEFGPDPTIITFRQDPSYELLGALQILSPVDSHYDDVFELEIGTMDGPAVFAQDVKLLQEAALVELNIEWMACNEVRCLPLDDQDFTIAIGNTAVLSDADAGAASAKPKRSSGNLLSMILAAILWGLAALVTPCVFPMIPMTVSFFLKGSQDKSAGRFRAIMYGVFIVLLYTVPIAVLILATRLLGGDAVTADIFNFLSTHWLPNILFFVIFMVFAASFFGAFEIVLPSSLVNGSDKNASKSKGLGGVFFLALTLVLVSFSCTGPIVGTVLIQSTSGEFWAPIVTMFAFSLTFALPFMLFALFPGILKKLPKSGGWLNSVKVVLGFVEIALGLKFLSVADQVYHWGLLNREIYLAIWIVCFTLLGFYLLGKLKFKNDSELPYISTFRLFLAIVDFTFVVYMIPGMWGAPLRALSGYLPPLESQEFVLGAQTQGATAEGPSTVTVDASAQGVKYADFLTLPLGLTGYFDLEQAREAAAKSGKPLFIDFTGHGCVNCREMESRVWSNPRVLQLLKEKFVICALYADDKLQLPSENWMVTESGKTLKTLGKINSYIALKQYGVASQPYYIIETPSGEQVGEPYGYNLDVQSFVNWLESVK